MKRKRSGGDKRLKKMQIKNPFSESELSSIKHHPSHTPFTYPWNSECSVCTKLLADEESDRILAEKDISVYSQDSPVKEEPKIPDNKANQSNQSNLSGSKKKKKKQDNSIDLQVYIVVTGEDYEGYQIQDVFSTVDKAKNFVINDLLPRQYKCHEWKEIGDCEWHSGGCDSIVIFFNTVK